MGMSSRKSWRYLDLSTALRSLGIHILLGYVLLTGWARAGEGDKPWPFYALREVQPPKVHNDVWVRNEIDSFILARLEDQELSPAAEAARATLIRRVYFDLIGLPPTPEELHAFLGDADPQAYENLVDRLLKDSRYGERWARLWLDLARYADTAGYEGDPDLPHAWRYRDYVIDAFNQDKPYDVFIKEQIAGDEFEAIMGAGELPDTAAERVVALTFLRLAPFTEPRGDESRHELLSEMTSTVGSVFLGLTVGCAKCHDHKYDSIPTRDFYRLQAFFATVSLPRPEAGDGFQIGGPLPAEFYRPGEAEWAAERRSQFEQEIVESKNELQELTARLEKKLINPEAAAKNGLQAAIDDPDNQLVSAEERQRYHYLASRERLVKQQLKRLKPLAMSLRHSYGPPYEPGVPTSRVMIRGEYDNPGEVVEPGFLSCITGHQEAAKIRLDPFKRWPTRSRRMALAEWFASPDNPLTARVMVNRLWHWHFGRGIVATPSDFGANSGGPSHPELLDWLAGRFVREQWSIKAMHRLIVTSSTYRQSSTAEFGPPPVDPDNTLLSRFRRRRLEAEAVRDTVLAVSGRLNAEQFGLPIFPPLPDGIEQSVKYTDSKWDTQYGAEGRKRSIYIYQQRTLSMPLMQVFDSLVCDESRPLRRASVTPLQALAMYNGEFVNEEAIHFAARVRQHAGDDPSQQIERAFLLALSRKPTAAEAEKMHEFLTTHESPAQALVGLCRILYNSNEFVYVD